MTTEYKLILNEDGASLFDGDGKPVSPEIALALMDKLGEHYKRPACVYLLRHESEDLYKIGMTAQVINSRISQIRYAQEASDIVLMHTIPCDTTTEALIAEGELHLAFEHRRSHGEWFYLSAEDVLNIQEISDGKDISIKFMALHSLMRRDHKLLKPKEKDDYRARLLHVENWIDEVQRRLRLE